MWLFAEYLPEGAALDRRSMPPIDELSDWLGEGTRVETIPLARDTLTGCVRRSGHPERVFDSVARAATSSFARMDSEVVERVLHELRRILTAALGTCR